MTQLIVTRLVLAIPTIIVSSILVFVALQMVPGDPVQSQLGLDYDPAVAEALRKEYGLDQPMPIRYLRWAGHVVRGDLGTSIFTGRPVLDELTHRLPISLQLLAISLTVSFLVAVPVGILAARRRGGITDLILMSASVVGISTPEFLVGAFLIYVFGLQLHWFDTIGFVRFEEDPLNNLRSLVLPGAALGVARAAILARLVRAELVEVLSADYIRTARAKGVHESAIVLRHALKNSLIPVVTVLGVQIGAVIGGSVVVESVFAIPGMGTYAITAMLKRDYPAIQGFVLLVTVGFILATLVVDVTYGWLDPRIRVRG